MGHTQNLLGKTISTNLCPLHSLYVRLSSYRITHHDHLAEESRDVDAQGHAGNDLLHYLQVPLLVPLDLWTPQETPGDDDIKSYNINYTQNHSGQVRIRGMETLPKLSHFASFVVRHLHPLNRHDPCSRGLEQSGTAPWTDSAHHELISACGYTPSFSRTRAYIVEKTHVDDTCLAMSITVPGSNDTPCCCFTSEIIVLAAPFFCEASLLRLQH